MKKSDKIAIRQKSIVELNDQLIEAKKKLIESRSKFALGNLKDTSLFKKGKYEIALIQTLIKEKQNEK